MYRRSQRWMLIINNRFLSLYDYNFLLVNQRLEKIFLEKPDWKKIWSEISKDKNKVKMKCVYLLVPSDCYLVIVAEISFPKGSSSLVPERSRKRFHKDNLRHLSRFPDFFVFKRILSAVTWKERRTKDHKLEEI